MEEALTLKYHFKGSNEEIKFLKLMCQISKNAYNSTLYLLRQYYFKHGSIPSYMDFYKMIEKNDSINSIEPKCYFSIVHHAYTNMQKYIKYYDIDRSLRPQYRNMDKEWLDEIRFPHYLPKHGLYIIECKQVVYKYNKRGAKIAFKFPLAFKLIRDSIFKFKQKDELLNTFVAESGLKKHIDIEFKIPRRCQEKEIKLVRIVPNTRGDYFEVNISYTIPKVATFKNNGRYLGIDLGMNNLTTCASTDLKSFIVDGRRLKSIIVLYNKKIANARELLPRISKKSDRQVKISHYILSLYRKKKRVIEEYLNKSVAIIIKYALENSLNTIIVGWNKNIKFGGIKNDDLSDKRIRQINQMFSDMPLSILKEKIVSRAKQNGLRVIVIDESYTSKKSFFDNDSFEKAGFSGERIKRGLYKTKTGSFINADTNAALNIIKKAVEHYHYFIKWNEIKHIPTPNRIMIN